jgi:hypothetical protein
MSKSPLSQQPLLVSPTAYHYLKQRTGKLSQANRELFFYILRKTLVALNHNWDNDSSYPYIPVSASFIKKTWHGKAKWKQLSDGGFLSATGYSKLDKMCREFRISDTILKELLARLRDDIVLATAPGEVVLVNALSGRRTKPKPAKSKLYDTNNNKIPTSIAEAIEAIKPITINWAAIKRELDAEELRLQGIQSSDPRWVAYHGALSIACHLRQSGTLDTSGKWLTYQPAYEMQSAGRITELGGGLQCLPRYLKAAALEDCDYHYDYYNYDMVSSQINLLKQLLEDAGIPTDSFDKYLAGDKKVYADKAGLSVDEWKICLLALVMGGTYGGAILTHLNRDRQKLNGFKKVSAPMKKTLNSFHQWLHQSYYPKRRRRSRKGFYVKNLVDANLYTDSMNVAELKRRLSAHLLQGTEACFIHWLTQYSSVYGYTVVNNQHDGLVTKGVIPPAAIKAAKVATKIQHADLKEKPIGTPRDPDLSYTQLPTTAQPPRPTRSKKAKRPRTKPTQRRQTPKPYHHPPLNARG